MDVVLAPTHLLDKVSSPWREIDLALCDSLRHELDRSGGADIAIDFQLITTNALLKDGPSRQTLISGIGNLPIQSIWLRTSGFGATATGAGTRSYVEAVHEPRELDRPLIADYVGGFAGLAAAAFGAVGAICHGLSQRPKSDWFASAMLWVISTKTRER